MIRKYEDGYYDLLTGLKVEDFSQLQYDKEYGKIIKEVDKDIKTVGWHWIGQNVTKLQAYDIPNYPLEIGDKFIVGPYTLQVEGFDRWYVVAVRVSNKYIEKLNIWRDLLQHRLKTLKSKIILTWKIWKN